MIARSLFSVDILFDGRGDIHGAVKSGLSRVRSLPKVYPFQRSAVLAGFSVTEATSWKRMILDPVVQFKLSEVERPPNYVQRKRLPFPVLLDESGNIYEQLNRLVGLESKALAA